MIELASPICVNAKNGRRHAEAQISGPGDLIGFGRGRGGGHRTGTHVCCFTVKNHVDNYALPARMLMAVPATAVIAMRAMMDWVIINTLAARDSGKVSAGLNATLVV
jgi:hypothetical protein